MSYYYTGIGSRKTPPNVLDKMAVLACMLADAYWILRSGGAEGADIAFEEGCAAAAGNHEIYWPWPDFNDRANGIVTGGFTNALPIARELHPAWNKCSTAAKKLHCRNIYQVLGWKLTDPSSVLVCWTKGGRAVGGTRTAIVLAEHLDIPVINLGLAKYSKLNAEDLFSEVFQAATNAKPLAATLATWVNR